MQAFEFLAQIRDKYFFEGLSTINLDDLENAYQEVRSDFSYKQNINNVPFLLKHVRSNKNIAKTEIRVILLLVEDLLIFGYRREIPLFSIIEELNISDTSLSSSLTLLEENKYVVRKRVDTKHKVVKLIFDAIF